MQDIREVRESGIFRELMVGRESAELSRMFSSRRDAVNERLESGETLSATITETRRIGRNDSCPCGSGDKFKRCCGARLPKDDERIRE